MSIKFYRFFNLLLCHALFAVMVMGSGAAQAAGTAQKSAPRATLSDVACSVIEAVMGEGACEDYLGGSGTDDPNNPNTVGATAGTGTTAGQGQTGTGNGNQNAAGGGASGGTGGTTADNDENYQSPGNSLVDRQDTDSGRAQMAGNSNSNTENHANEYAGTGSSSTPKDVAIVKTETSDRNNAKANADAIIASAKGRAQVAQTLGQVIKTTGNSTSGFPTLLAIISYISGLFLILQATLRVRQHVDDPRSMPIWDPLKRYGAGGMFLALPYMTKVAVGSVTDGISPMGLLKPGNYTLSDGSASGGLDQLLIKLVADIAGPMQGAFAAFSYIAGLALLVIGISRLIKTSQEGPRGPTGTGTWVTFFTAATFLSIGQMMGAVTASLFGDSQVISFSGLSANMTAGLEGNVENVNNVIKAIFVFMMIIGWISFIRGFFILRTVSEGGQASMMAGITHILGGAIAVNLGPFMSAVQATFGLSNYGLQFT